jgi:hypothetical protein
MAFFKRSLSAGFLGSARIKGVSAMYLGMHSVICAQQLAEENPADGYSGHAPTFWAYLIGWLRDVFR